MEHHHFSRPKSHGTETPTSTNREVSQTTEDHRRPWQIVANNYLEFWLRYASVLEQAEVQRAGVRDRTGTKKM